MNDLEPIPWMLDFNKYVTIRLLEKQNPQIYFTHKIDSSVFCQSCAKPPTRTLGIKGGIGKGLPSSTINGLDSNPFTVDEPEPAKCTCDIMALMRVGCKCGWIEKERAQ